MARDYKRKYQGARKKRPESGGNVRRGARDMLWMGIGLAFGLAITYGVHVYDTGRVRGLAEGNGSGSAPALGPGKKATGRPARRTRFEFYSLLPEMEVVVPESEIPTRDARPAPKPATRKGTARPSRNASRPGERFVLQAGAFRDFADADRLRATLALSGLEARIQTVSVDGKPRWHRVRLGPYATVAELNRVRRRLELAHIKPVVLKIRV